LPASAPTHPGPYMRGFVPLDGESMVAPPPTPVESPALPDPIVPAADPVGEGLFWTELEG